MGKIIDSDLTVTGTISGAVLYGDGSNLTGISVEDNYLDIIASAGNVSQLTSTYPASAYDGKWIFVDGGTAEDGFYESTSGVWDKKLDDSGDRTLLPDYSGGLADEETNIMLSATAYSYETDLTTNLDSYQSGPQDLFDGDYGDPYYKTDTNSGYAFGLMVGGPAACRKFVITIGPINPLWSQNLKFYGFNGSPGTFTATELTIDSINQTTGTGVTITNNGVENMDPDDVIEVFTTNSEVYDGYGLYFGGQYSFIYQFEAYEVINNTSTITAVNTINKLHAGYSQINETALTEDTPLDNFDGVVLLDASSGGFTLNLPPVATVLKGKTYTFKKIDSTANIITLAGDGSDTIDGSSEISDRLIKQWQTVTIISDGTQWLIKSVGVDVETTVMSISGDTALTGIYDMQVFVDTTINPVLVTLPNGFLGQEVEIIDVGDVAQNNIISVLPISGSTIDGGSSTTIEIGSGSRKFVFNSEWESSGGIERFFTRNALTNRIRSVEPDQLVADTLAGGDIGTSYIGTPDNFEQAEVNVDQGSNDWGNGSSLTNIAQRSYTDGVDIWPIGQNYTESNNAFDGNESTGGGLSPLTQPVAFVIDPTGSPVSISRIELVVRYGQDYEVDGSNDWNGSSGTWTNIIGPLTRTGLETLAVGIPSPNQYRYYRLKGVSTANSFDCREMRLFEASPFNTSNTFQYRLLTAGSSTKFDTSTFSPKDENGTGLVDGDILIEYSTDGSTFSTQVGLNAFKALGVITATTFWLRYEMVGDKRLSSTLIQTAATYAQMSNSGLSVISEGVEVAKAGSNGLHVPSGTIGDLGTSFTGIAESDYEQAEANVEQGEDSWGNTKEVGSPITGLTLGDYTNGGGWGSPFNNFDAIVADDGLGPYCSWNSTGIIIVDLGTDAPITKIDSEIRQLNTNNPGGFNIEAFFGPSSSGPWTSAGTTSRTDSQSNWVVASINTIDSGVTGRYCRMEFDAVSVTNKDCGVDYITFYGADYSSENNKFQYRPLTGGDSTTYSPSTLVVLDETDTTLLDGDILIEYSTDGSTWSPQYGLNAFKALSPITGTTFWLRYEMVGDKRLKSSEITTASSYVNVTTEGLEIISNGNSRGFALSEVVYDFSTQSIAGGTPSEAEITSTFGAPSGVGDGYSAIMAISGGGSLFQVVSDGSSWWSNGFTKAT
jgi:hypothetical protein